MIPQSSVEQRYNNDKDSYEKPRFWYILNNLFYLKKYQREN
jgi:hypothetical protein